MKKITVYTVWEADLTVGRGFKIATFATEADANAFRDLKAAAATDPAKEYWTDTEIRKARKG